MFALQRYITFINSVFDKMWLTGIYGPIPSVIHPLISWSYMLSPHMLTNVTETDVYVIIGKKYSRISLGMTDSME